MNTIRANIQTPYSLHDMNLTSFEIQKNTLTLHSQSGMIKTTPPFSHPDGSIEFQQVDWDFSFVYLFDFCGNSGTFSAEKKFLKDFLQNDFKDAFFEVIDETYGYNQSHFGVYLSKGCELKECMIHIYHHGDMVYVIEE